MAHRLVGVGRWIRSVLNQSGAKGGHFSGIVPPIWGWGRWAWCLHCLGSTRFPAAGRCRAPRSRFRSQAWRAAACPAAPTKAGRIRGAERTRVGGGGGRFCGGRVIRGRGAPLAQAAAVICRSLSQAAAIDYGSPPSGVEAATITNVQAATTINRCHLVTPPSGGARNHCGCAGITA